MTKEITATTENILDAGKRLRLSDAAIERLITSHGQDILELSLEECLDGLDEAIERRLLLYSLDPGNDSLLCYLDFRCGGCNARIGALEPIESPDLPDGSVCVTCPKCKVLLLIPPLSVVLPVA